jgi:hypothetical protein
MSGQKRGPNSVDLTELNPRQLTELRKSLGQEIQFITQNFAALKEAHSRYTQSLAALDEFTPENEGIGETETMNSKINDSCSPNPSTSVTIVHSGRLIARN